MKKILLCALVFAVVYLVFAFVSLDITWFLSEGKAYNCLGGTCTEGEHKRCIFILIAALAVAITFIFSGGLEDGI